MENAPCPQYRNTLDALRSIWQTEGFATLYKGVTMNFVKGTTPKPVVVSLEIFLISTVFQKCFRCMSRVSVVVSL